MRIPRNKRPLVKKLLFYLSILLLVLFLVFVVRPTYKIAKSIVTKTPTYALKNDNGRTNVVLLGTGGAGHEGPNLTDTIIVVSATASGQITMISIPRDIYLDSLQGKINTAYAIGQEDKNGTGLAMAETAVSEIVGMPIQYGVRVDFSAFEEIINTLGGIDVNVPAVLDDYQFPVNNKEEDLCGLSPFDISSREATLSAEEVFPCRYDHLHFDVGLQHMDGKTALNYVRSRHADGEEGTDFARSRRQQLVIKAVKDKALNASNFLNPVKVKSIYDEVKKHVDTDIDTSHPDQLIAMGLGYRNSNIKNIYLDLNLLDNPPIDYRGWILVPKDGTWTQIHEYIKSQL